MTRLRCVTALALLAAGSSAAPTQDETFSLSLHLGDDTPDVPPPASAPRSHRVFVGASGQTKFYPSQVTAGIGDVVRFEFLAVNHSVAQSSFDAPCVADGPFSTDFFEFDPRNRTQSTIDLLVTTTNPQWFFCQQRIPFSHCSNGMVFAINAGDHWAEYTSRALGDRASSTGLPHANTATGAVSVVTGDFPSGAWRPPPIQSGVFPPYPRGPVVGSVSGPWSGILPHAGGDASTSILGSGIAPPYQGGRLPVTSSIV